MSFLLKRVERPIFTKGSFPRALRSKTWRFEMFKISATSSTFNNFSSSIFAPVIYYRACALLFCYSAIYPKSIYFFIKSSARFLDVNEKNSSLLLLISVDTFQFFPDFVSLIVFILSP